MIESGIFAGLERGRYGAILADPPWHFDVWSENKQDNRRASSKYDVLKLGDICRLPVGALAASDCILFLWAIWPMLPEAFEVIRAWGFEYKTCAFDWIKADAKQLELFRDDHDVQMGLGYWTRANSEPCLLATRGKPRRLNADVRQGIIAPRREHSRKPDGVHERIERLVAGPYLELFARQRRSNWQAWGNDLDRYPAVEAVDNGDKPSEWADMWARPFDLTASERKEAAK